MYWRIVWRIVWITTVVLSLSIAILVCVLWGSDATGLRGQRLITRGSSAYWSCDYDPVRGGKWSTTEAEAYAGGIEFARQSNVLPTQTQLAAAQFAAPGMVNQMLALFTQDAGRRGLILDGHLLFGRLLVGQSPLANLTSSTLMPAPPTWDFGGFRFSYISASAMYGNNGTFTALRAPYWFILILALIAPIIAVRRSVILRAGRRLLAGQCPQCGCDRQGSTGPCGGCGTAPGWGGRFILRLGGGRSLLWWIPALAAGLCALCVKSDPYDMSLEWREGWVGIAALYMLGVAAVRAFVRRHLPEESSRGFAVVINSTEPPPLPDAGPGATNP